jgi:hypothetical protein
MDFPRSGRQSSSCVHKSCGMSNSNVSILVMASTLLICNQTVRCVQEGIFTVQSVQTALR